MNIDIENLEHMDFSDVVDADADADLIPPTRPGDILRHDFLEPLHMSANALARNLRVPTNRVTSILSGTRRVSADTALRLSRYFGTSAAFWLNLQASYDLELAKRRAGERIRHEVDPRAA